MDRLDALQSTSQSFIELRWTKYVYTVVFQVAHRDGVVENNDKYKNTMCYRSISRMKTLHIFWSFSVFHAVKHRLRVYSSISEPL